MRLQDKVTNREPEYRKKIEKKCTGEKEYQQLLGQSRFRWKRYQEI